MKLVYKNLEKDGTGRIALVPEEAEDMWHAYNLVAIKDYLTASTFRKVQSESATGSVVSTKIRTTLTVAVETIFFDTQACVLSVKGRNVVENQHVKLGAYHTLDLELNRKFTLVKKHWDSIHLDRIDMACNPAQSADLAAIVMHEGLAHICLVSSCMTLLRGKIETSIPRKRKGMCSQHDKGLIRFFESIIQTILRHVDFEIVKCVIIGSPGFVKDQFFDYMLQYAVKEDHRVLLDNKQKFMTIHTSSGFKHTLKEVLNNPIVTSRIADTKAAGEVKALDNFYYMLQVDPNKAFYGIKHVEYALECEAIDTLLISDALFRSQDIAERKRYVALVDNVRENCGEVKIFSSSHVSGEQLDQLTGVAAILRFPLEELEDDDSSDDED
ncbi:Protein pelota [Nymphon striatum]|nr:Protein pelota [Nymphon striatum]